MPLPMPSGGMSGLGSGGGRRPPGEGRRSERGGQVLKVPATRQAEHSVSLPGIVFLDDARFGRGWQRMAIGPKQGGAKRV
jgi:hypothetical protein